MRRHDEGGWHYLPGLAVVGILLVDEVEEGGGEDKSEEDPVDWKRGEKMEKTKMK